MTSIKPTTTQYQLPHMVLCGQCDKPTIGIGKNGRYVNKLGSICMACYQGEVVSDQVIESMWTKKSNQASKRHRESYQRNEELLNSYEHVPFI